MPFYPIKDKKTGKSYQMPWHDAVSKPSTEQVKKFVFDQENRSLPTKAWDAMTTPLSNVGSYLSENITEPLWKYGEGEALKYGGHELLPQLKRGEERGLGRSLASVTGAFGQGVGEQVNEMTSPLGLATTVAGPAGYAAKGLGLGMLGRGLSAAPKAAGAVMGAHGAYGLTQAETPGQFLGSGAELALGALGTGGLSKIAGRTRPPVEPRFTPPNAAGAIDDIAGPMTRVPRASQYANRVSNVMEGEALPHIYEGSVVGEEGLIRRPVSPSPMAPPSPLPPRQTLLPPVPPVREPLGLPSGPTNTGRGPAPPQGPFFSSRRGTGTSIKDVTNLGDIEPGPRESFSGAPASETVEEAAARARKTSQFQKSPTLTRAEKQEIISNPDSPLRKKISKSALKKLIEDEGGYLDVEEIARGLQQGKTWVKDRASQLRTKFLDNVEAADNHYVRQAGKAASAITGPEGAGGASLSGAWKSGWAHIEETGPAGKKISRLMQRARTDIRTELAGHEKAGTIPTTEKGIPSVREGKILWERHGDEIKNLINEIPDEASRKRVTEIIDMQVGRTPTQHSSFEKGVQSIKALQALTKLSQFVVGNTSAAATIAARGNVGAIGNAFRKTLFDYKNALAEAKKTGALDNIIDGIGKEVGDGKLSDVINKSYGIKASERFMRTASALTGKQTAEELFTQLKANPDNKRALRRLDDLLLEDDFGALLKQDKLTPAQLDRAGGRMSELTQGIAEPIDVPPMWSGHPLIDLALQFKKYGFMQTRNLKEAFKADPLRTAAAMAIAFPAVGEVVGDVKAGIKGAVKTGKERSEGKKSDLFDNMWNEAAGRGTGKDRYFADASQAWALGLAGDLYEASGRGPAGFAKELAGPTIGDIGEAAYGAYELANKGQSYHLKRQAARTIPYVGTGIAGEIKGSYAGRQKRRKREKRSRN